MREMIDQRHDIFGHFRRVIGGGLVELAGLAVAAIIERDHAAAGARQLGDPARIDPVHLRVRAEAVNQDDRRGMALILALIEIGDLDLAVTEAWHAASS